MFVSLSFVLGRPQSMSERCHQPLGNLSPLRASNQTPLAKTSSEAADAVLMAKSTSDHFQKHENGLCHHDPPQFGMGQS
jgi:hypothetical protein